MATQMMELGVNVVFMALSFDPFSELFSHASSVHQDHDPPAVKK